MSTRPRAQPFTPRELAVLWLVAEGQRNWQIGAALGIARQTVRKHLENINRRTGGRSRTQAVVLAMKLGLIR